MTLKYETNLKNYLNFNGMIGTIVIADDGEERN
jgi:hypothetical protein